MLTSQLGCRTETAAVFVHLSGLDYLSRETALTFDLWLLRKNPGCLVAAHVAWLCCSRYYSALASGVFCTWCAN